MKRFWDKVKKTSSCWLWNGTIDRGGYGIYYENGPIKAHRYSYKLHKGVIDSEKFVCHRCDIRNCVNPYHLFQGTVLDNNRDKMIKGRCSKISFPKESNPMAKLSLKEVIEIREIYAFGGISQSLIAEAYGITQPTVWAIVRGKLWT